MMKKPIQLMIVTLAFFFWALPCQASPVVVIPDASYRFETVPEGTEVVHEFIVQNAGDSDLHIEEVRVD